MPLRKHEESEFDRFRRERQRARRPQGFGQGPGGLRADHAMRDIERVERHEVQQQRLSRDVRDFFDEATRQAKSIVERVARDAQHEAKAKIEQEVELFLLDALERMNGFLGGCLAGKGGDDEEQDFLPTIQNIVGDVLDEFRESGTASTDDKHLGKDPFQINVQEVQRIFRERIAKLRTGGEEQPPTPGPDGSAMVDVEEDVGIAEEYSSAQDLVPPPVPTRARTKPGDPAAAAGNAPVARPVPPAPAATTANVPPAQPTKTQPTPATTPTAPTNATPSLPPTSAGAAPVDPAALDRLRQALKLLVADGSMSRDEAVAIWRKRVAGG